MLRIFLDSKKHAEEKQQQQAAAHDANVRVRAFKTGQSVFVKDYTGNWLTRILGTVIAVTGPVSYVCSTGNGEHRCHCTMQCVRYVIRLR